MNQRNEKEYEILKSKFFLRLFGIPSIVLVFLSFLSMILDEGGATLTLGDIFSIDILLVLLWFGISFLITLGVHEINRNRAQSIKKESSSRKKTNSIDSRIGVDKKELETATNLSANLHSKVIKTGMLLLFVLTIVSLWGALIIVFMVNEMNHRHGFDFVKDMWIFWCLLPIPILSILLGFKYKKAGFKCTKNIVAGFIIGFLLLIYGSFCRFPTYSEDYSKLDAYRDMIDVELPEHGELHIQDWNNGDKLEYTVVSVYYDKQDVRNLVNSIENSDNWILSTEIKSLLTIFLPSSFRSNSDTYFSIYNQSTNQYNTIPEASGDYEIYAMKYDQSEKLLEIHKFVYSYR